MTRKRRPYVKLLTHGWKIPRKSCRPGSIIRLKTAVPSVKEFDEPLAALKANRDLSKLADLNKKISALEQRKAKGRKISESDLKSLTQAVDKFTESDNEATQTAASSLKKNLSSLAASETPGK